jgi:hypothetical protein
LIRASVVSGCSILLLFILIYKIMQILFPGVLEAWCHGCNPTGIVLSGINLEELIWDFSWGLVGGAIYEATRGKRLRKRVDNNTTKYNSFDTFNRYCDQQFTAKLNSTYGQFMASSSKNVLSIRLIRQVCYHLFHSMNHEMEAKHAIMVLPLVPLLLNIILYPFGLSSNGYLTWWLAYSVIMNYCLLVFPQVTWSNLVNLSDMVDNLLETQEDKLEYIAWMTRRLNLRVQLILSFVGGLLGILILLLFSLWSKGTVQVDIPSTLSVLITGSLGINAVYWLWGVPLQIQKLYLFSQTHVKWNDPAGTPGIRSQSQLLGISAILAAIGVAIFIVPLLWFLFSLPIGILLVDVINVTAFAASLATVFFVAVFPQYWLSAIVYREKNRILDSLEKEISTDRAKKQRNALAKWQLIEHKVNVYQAIKSTSISTIDIQTLGNYAIAILTTALPYVIQWLTP